MNYQKMQKYLLGIVCGVLCWTPAPAIGQTAPLTISPAEIRPHIEYLASPDREGRDDWGKIESRDYIISEFKRFEIQPLFDGEFIQVVPKFGDNSKDPLVVGQNVGGFIPGTDEDLKQEWIIINAHYDHLGVRRGRVYPGADDNASGVAMLLEVAKKLSQNRPRRSVAFLAFDLEEYLLWGSRWFVAHPPMEIDSIKFCLTADMIGRSLGGLEIPSVFVMGSERSITSRNVLNHVEIPEGLEIARLGVDIVGVRSDYGPFYYRQIPFLFFSTGEHPQYHTPQDTIETIDFKKAARISTVMLRVAQQISNQAGPIIWDPAPAADLSEVEAVHRVCTHLMDADDTGNLKLTDLQRFFISQVLSKTKFILQRQTISDEERKWLVRSTQLLMFSIF